MGLLWETSTIAAKEHAARFGLKPALVLITGAKDSGKKPMASSLESRLLTRGYNACVLDIANTLYGVDADIKGKTDDRREYIKRLAEVAHIFLSAGFILLVTAFGLQEEELVVIRTMVDTDQIVTVWRGGSEPGLVHPDASLSESETVDGSVGRLPMTLRERGILRLHQ